MLASFSRVTCATQVQTCSMQSLSLSLSIPFAVFSTPAISSRSSCSTGRSFRTLFFPFVCEFRGFRRTSRVLMSNVTPVAVPVSADESATPCETRNPDSDVLIQYVVLRRDLIDTWPLGSILAQGCHASVAAIWADKDDLHTAEYCGEQNLDRMHKVVLEVKGETQIINLSEKLVAGAIAHKLWIEQPENIPTCLATKPYPKSVVSSFFRKLKLCK